MGFQFHQAGSNRLEVTVGCVEDALQRLVEFEGVDEGCEASRSRGDDESRSGGDEEALQAVWTLL